MDMSVEQEILETGIKVVDMLAPYCKGGKIGRFTVVSFRLKRILATRDVCKRPLHLHHWNLHSISDPVIPHIAVYNAYSFVTKQINTSTVFVHVSDCMIGTGQTENTSCRKSTGDFSRHMQCKHENNYNNAKKTFFLFI